MGWGSGSEIFNQTAHALIDSGASGEVVTKTLAKVIPNLLSEDWDTYDESLDHFYKHPAVVEAFRQNEIYLEYCEADNPDSDKSWARCRKEAGHVDDHQDRYEKTWPQVA